MSSNPLPTRPKRETKVIKRYGDSGSSSDSDSGSADTVATSEIDKLKEQVMVKEKLKSKTKKPTSKKRINCTEKLSKFNSSAAVSDPESESDKKYNSEGMEANEETEEDDDEESEEYQDSPPKKRSRKKNALKNAKGKKSSAAQKKVAEKKTRGKKKSSTQSDVKKEVEDNSQPDANKEKEDEDVDVKEDVKAKIEKVPKLEGDVQFLDADGKIIACCVSDRRSDHNERLVQGMRSRIVSGQVCDCKFIVTIYGYIILF